MATRLYLPTSGTPGSTPTVATTWEQSIAAFTRFPMSTAKADSALTDYASLHGSTSTSQTLWHQWISDTLDVDQTISGTLSMVVRCLEGALQEDQHLAFTARVMIGDTSTGRGVLLQVHATSTEFPTVTPATRIHDTLAITTVNALAGDRICMEISTHGVTPGNLTANTLRFGDPTATADFALTAGLTTDLVPWMELSANLTFGAPPAGGQARRTMHHFQQQRAA
jgi:hypothetical protein